MHGVGAGVEWCRGVGMLTRDGGVALLDSELKVQRERAVEEHAAGHGAAVCEGARVTVGKRKRVSETVRRGWTDGGGLSIMCEEKKEKKRRRKRRQGQRDQVQTQS